MYQLTDHLGNVRAVIAKQGTNAVALVGATDYYPFGMAMPNRIFGANGYRYQFQGQEKDPETGKEAFQLRLWDGRIGRWLTTDPYGQYASPYLGMGNNPISRIDPDGGADCPPGQTCENHVNQLDEIVISAKSYHPLTTQFMDNDYFAAQVWEMEQAIYQGHRDFLTNEVTIAFAAIVALPFALEAAIASTPFISSEAALIYGGRHIIGKTLFSGFTTYSAGQAALNFTSNAGSQFLTNGYKLGNIDFFDSTISAMFGGIGSTYLQSQFDFTFNGNGIIFNTNQTFISEFSYNILINGLHSKIKIPSDTWFGNTPMIDVGNMFTELGVSTSIKSIDNNFNEK